MERTLQQLVLYFQNIASNSKKYVIAIDGPGGAGKSYLAKKISSLLHNCEIVQFDYFYSPWNNQELNGPNFDWQRLKEQVLIPYWNDRKYSYQLYNWSTGKLDSWKETGNLKFLIVEGVTSGRAELREYINFIIYIETPIDTRIKRGIERDGMDSMDIWLNDWAPREDKYFNSPLHNTKQISDLVIDGTYINESNSDMINTIYEKNNYFELQSISD